VATRHVSPTQNIPKLRLRPGLCPRPHWESLQRSPRPLAAFKGSASQQRRDGRVDRARGEGRGGRGEEWRDWEKHGEEREKVDISPSCKNPCRRLWLRHRRNYALLINLILDLFSIGLRCR